MSKPFFSILVPVYDQEGKMDNCIRSILEQSFGDFEALLVDDGSTDRSYEMLCAYAETDARFRVFRHEKNRSLLCARYTGMKHSAGDYCLFLDSDDALEPDALETLCAHIRTQSTDVIRFGLLTVPGKYPLLPVPSDDPFRDFIAGRLPPQIIRNCISSRVIRKAVETITPFYCNSGEDTFMSGTLFFLAESFSDIRKCLMRYNMIGGMSREKESLTGSKLDRTLDSLDRCTEQLTRYCLGHYPGLIEDCRTTCGMMYRYEMCHYLLNARDERQLCDFLVRFEKDEWCAEFDYACRTVLPEYFRRRFGISEGDRFIFNTF